MSVKHVEAVSIAELKVGSAYKLASRNIHIGIWDGKHFHGVRTKFGHEFMDSEIHYDLDDRYGSAVAIKELK